MFEVRQKLIYKPTGGEATVAEVHEDHIMVIEPDALWALMVFDHEYSDYEAA